MEIREVSAELASAVDQHLLRHIAESGRHGIHWLPFDAASIANPPVVSPESLGLPTDAVGWQRWFAVLNDEGTVVGHLSLKGSKFSHVLHRTELGMGLEYPYRGMGLGYKLMAFL